jgi:hypothetical protein
MMNELKPLRSFLELKGFFSKIFFKFLIKLIESEKSKYQNLTVRKQCPPPHSTLSSDPPEISEPRLPKTFLLTLTISGLSAAIHQKSIPKTI